MRRIVVIVMVACLAAGAVAAPAEAAKKRKKKKPISLSVEGAFAIANPGDFLAGAGLVRNELQATCTIPATQGADGFVVELPAPFQKINSEASLSGQDATGGPDLDMYFYDEACAPTGEVATAELSEFGIIPSGTKFVVVSAFFGADITFTLDAVEKR